MAQGEPLGYDNFQWGTTIDNMVLFFAEGALANAFREESSFKELQRDSPDLVARLLAEIPAARPWSKESLEPHRRNLHTAYLTLRKFYERDADFGINRSD